jgi:hypothetical protein
MKNVTKDATLTCNTASQSDLDLKPGSFLVGFVLIQDTQQFSCIPCISTSTSFYSSII